MMKNIAMGKDDKLLLRLNIFEGATPPLPFLSSVRSEGIAPLIFAGYAPVGRVLFIYQITHTYTVASLCYVISAFSRAGRGYRLGGGGMVLPIFLNISYI